MASRQPSRQAMIVFGIFVLLAFIGNMWISYKLKMLEEVLVVTQTSVDQKSDLVEHSEHFGIVKIDPDNDPLAPVVNLASQKAAPIKSEVSDSSSPVYEAPSDSVVLIQ